MFLNKLNAEEKKAFLDLAYWGIMSNNEFHKLQKDLLKYYCNEMNISSVNTENVMKLNDIFSVFDKSDETIKKIVFFELFFIIKVDGVYDNEEKLFMNDIAKKLGVSDSMVEKFNNILTDYVSIVSNIQRMLFDKNEI